jgi:hypothetical protein
MFSWTRERNRKDYFSSTATLTLTLVLPGDYNHNGVVDTANYTVWRDSLGQTGAGLAADGNGNGVIEWRLRCLAVEFRQPFWIGRHCE